MADWRRRSIAGGPSPSTPNGDIPGALHLDFFYRPGATRTAFPSDEAGGTMELEAATMPTRRLSNATTYEAFLLLAADGDRRTAVTPPATMDEASPLQPRQRQAGGGGSRRRLSWSAHGSSGRVSSPTSSQLPPLPDHVAAHDEAGEEEEEAVWPSSDEDFEEDDTLYVQNDDEDQAKSSGCSEGQSEGGDEGTSSGRGDENDEAMSPERGEEDDEGGAMSPGREEDEDDENDEDDWDAEEEEEDEEEEEEEEPKSPPKCFDCETTENLVMLIPCRHACYCKRHFIIDGWRSGPGRLHCPICGHEYTEGHPQVGRLGPAKK